MSSSSEKDSAKLLTTRLVAAANFSARLLAPASGATLACGPGIVPAAPWPGGPVPLLAYVIYPPHYPTLSHKS